MPKKIRVARNEGMAKGIDMASEGTEILIKHIQEDIELLEKLK